ncbi:hypothetical protein PanWU01x14_126520 [Parasponia andersonii]|uniref:Uncharacterized protein n=1 Tax=Parasponia andersonii TaxID=3476 RepID=A0A2P5CSW3_PARAD|nr:hypothetical protein PanWU01x14_126520 [Parasponia andersonii]
MICNSSRKWWIDPISRQKFVLGTGKGILVDQRIQERREHIVGAVVYVFSMMMIFFISRNIISSGSSTTTPQTGPISNRIITASLGAASSSSFPSSGTGLNGV